MTSQKEMLMQRFSRHKL